MPETTDIKTMQKQLFLHLVIMLSSSAMQQMGKLVDPSTGRSQANLEAAQLTIDMLEALREKTRGNLDHDEEDLLTNSLSSLQLTYVETARATTEEPPHAPPPAPGESSDASPSVKAAPGKGTEAKFHKAYG